MKILERYLLPSNENSYIDPNGLLQVTDLALDYGKLIGMKKAISLPGGILIAEAGVGKTTYLERIKELTNEGRVILHKLGWYVGTPVEFLSELEKAICDADGQDTVVLLDGVDEAPELAKAILKFLAASHQSTQIWITSRDCPAIQFIHKKYESIALYKLAPLQRSDICDLAINANVNPDRFYETAEQKGILPICAKPLGCEHAIDLFKANGLVAVSQLNLLEQGIKRLCDENWNSTHLLSSKYKFTLDQIVDCASWIALSLSLTGNQFIWTGLESHPKGMCITLSDITNDRYSLDLINVTLQRGVFIPIGDGRTTFAHELYRDYLTANGTVKNINEDCWTQFYFNSKAEAVYPQHAGIAVWLAVRSSSFLNKIFVAQPELLLSIEDAVQKVGRSELCEAILNRADHLSYEHRWGSSINGNLHRLKSKATTEILRRILGSADSSMKQIDLAIAIAEKCSCVELSHILADKALNLDLDYNERVSAAHAVKRLADPVSIVRLLDLLMLDRADDPDDELRGAAVSACWPDSIELVDLLAQLVKPNRKGLYGTYKWFLIHEFPESFKVTIDSGNAHELLRWAIPHLGKDRHSDEFAELSREIFTYCWQYANEQKIASELAEGYVKAVKAFEIPFKVTDSIRMTRSIEVITDEQFANDANGRLSVLREVIMNQGVKIREHGIVPWADYPLYTSDDLPVLFEIALTNNNYAETEKWAECIKMALSQIELDKYEGKINKLHDKVPESVESYREIRKSYVEDAEHMNRLMRSRQERENENEIKKFKAQANIDTRLKAMLSSELDDASDFELINQMLNCKDGYHYIEKIDIRLSPGWDKLSTIEKDKVLDSAISYLRNATIVNTKPDRVKLHVATAMTAVRLMRFNSFEELDESVWNRCAVELIKSHSSDTAEIYTPLFDRLADKYPEVATTALIEIAVQELKRDVLFVIRAWGARLSDIQTKKILELLDRDDFPNELRIQLLNDILEAGKEQLVRQYVMKILEKGWVSNKSNEFHAYRLMAFCFDPLQFIDEMIESFHKDPKFGKEWLDYISGFENSYVGALVQCNVDDIARMFIWLHNNYPQSNEPRRDVVHTVRSEHRIYEYKSKIITYLSRSGREGTSMALNKLYEEFDDMEWVTDCVLNARSAELGSEAPVLTVDELKRISNVNVGKKWILSSDADLQELILVVLQEYGEWLQGDEQGIRYLWDMQNAVRPRSEEELSDLIRTYMRLRFDEGIVVNREVQISPKQKQAGKEGCTVDIWIQALGKDRAPLTVCIEVKCNWNDSARQAMRNQLVGKYLSGGTAKVGIFLLGWFECEKWDKEDWRKGKSTVNWKDIETAREELAGQAEALCEEGRSVKSIVVDCRLPSK